MCGLAGLWMHPGSAQNRDLQQSAAAGAGLDAIAVAPRQQLQHHAH